MLRFAPRSGSIASLVKPQHGHKRRTAANDNGLTRPDGTAGGTAGANDHDDLIEAALRLFAAHGLSAAQRAHEAAVIAARMGERDKARWWMAICAALDGGLARGFDRREGGRR
jgi:hypothetical protein